MSVISDLKSNVNRLCNALNSIKNVLLSKGINIDDGIESYANQINQMYEGTNVSDTTATKNEVLDGFVFHDKNGLKTNGQMKNYGNTTFVLENQESVNVAVNGYIKNMVLKTNMKKAVGTFTTSTNGTRIPLTFQPDIIIVSSMQNGTVSGNITKTETTYYYNDGKSDSFGFIELYHTGNSYGSSRTTKPNRLPTIDNNGFIYKARYANKTAYYVALQA